MFRLSDLDLALTDGLILGLSIPAFIYLAYHVYRPLRGGRPILWWLLGLRSLGAVLVLVVLMEPILAVTVRARRRPLVAVLIDDSESMRVVDAGRPRRDAVLDILGGEALGRLNRDARISHYRFSESLSSLSGQASDSLGWDGRATDLAGALDALGDEVAGQGLVAVVLLSDGGHNFGGRPERSAAELGVPIIAVGVGSPESPRDVALVSSSIDPVGYVGRELSISLGVKSSGYDGAQGVLQVSEGGQTIGLQPVTLRDGEQRVGFDVTPRKAGRHVYRLRLAPQSGERSEENNTAIVSTEVLESRVRVLLVGGGPSADLAYLRRSVESDRNVELQALVPTPRKGLAYQLRGRLNRPEEWDVVILLDVPGDALSGLPEHALASFVRSGGGLLVIGGERCLDDGYAGSPLAEVLPVQLLRESGTYRPEPFQLEIPESALQHPIMRITEHPLADRSAWEELPPLLAYNRTRGARTGATVLARHPTEEVGGDRMPLLAVAHVDGGKTMVVGVRSFWRLSSMMWGIGKTDAVPRTFWRNALRWLVTREDVARVRAGVDKPSYRSGEPVTFHAQVLDEFLRPQEGAQVTVSLADSAGVREVVLREEGRARYSGRMPGKPQGDYTYQVHARKGDVDLGGTTGRLTVGRYSLEYEEVRMKAELLKELSARSGGRFVDPEGFAAAIRDLPISPQPVTVIHRWRLWGHRWPLFLLVCLLAVEWTVRRRRGMI